MGDNMKLFKNDDPLSPNIKYVAPFLSGDSIAAMMVTNRNIFHGSLLDVDGESINFLTLNRLSNLGATVTGATLAGDLDVHDIVNVAPRLERLDLRQCSRLRNADVLAAFPRLQSLAVARTLASDLASFNCPTLVELVLRDVNLDEPDFFLGECPRLKSLDLRGSAGFDLESLAQLPGLKTLLLNTPDVPSELEPLTACKELERLEITGSCEVDDLNPISQLKRLKLASFSFTLVENLEPLTHCKKLTSLDLSFTRVNSVSHLAKLPKLERLNLSGCSTLWRVDSLKELKCLKVLKLDNTQVKHIKPLASCVELTELHLAGTKVCDITPLSDCIELKHLTLSHLTLKSLDALASCPNLQVLLLGGTSVSDISPLANCINLRVLHLGATQVSNLSPLRNCVMLRELTIVSTDVQDVSCLSHCPHLTILKCGSTSVNSIDSLQKCERLRTLDISRTAVSDVTALTHCKNLHNLVLMHTPVSDLTALNSLPNLESVNLYGTNVSSVSSLSHCKHLRYLNLSSTGVSDLSPLSNCHKIKNLLLCGTGVSDLSPVSSCRNLKSLHVRESKIKLTHVREFFPTSPDGGQLNLDVDRPTTRRNRRRRRR